MMLTKETRFGLFTSILKEPLAALITGATKDGNYYVTLASYVLQDGSLQDHSRVINSGVVGGKL